MRYCTLFLHLTILGTFLIDHMANIREWRDINAIEDADDVRENRVQRKIYAEAVLGKMHNFFRMR